MIYNPERRLRLRELGYNPDEVEEFNPEPPQPTVAQQPTKEVPQVGRIRSILSNAAAALPSTAASLYAGSKIGTAGTILGGPLVGIPAGIAAAIGTGLLARKAQDAIIRETPLGPAYEKELEQTREAHPNYSAAGEVLGSLPLMRPSLGVLNSARKVITKPLTGVASTAAEKANALNVGLGAAVPVGINLAQGQSITPETVIQSVGGALLNKPTALGVMAGLTPSVVERPTGEGLAERNATSELVAKAKEVLQLKERNSPIVTPEPPKPIRVGPQTDLTSIEQQLKDAPVLQEYAKAKAEKEALEAKLTEETRRLQEQAELLKKISQPSPKDPNYTPPEVQPKVSGELETSVNRTPIAEPRTVDADPKDINWQELDKVAVDASNEAETVRIDITKTLVKELGLDTKAARRIYNDLNETQLKKDGGLILMKDTLQAYNEQGLLDDFIYNDLTKKLDRLEFLNKTTGKSLSLDSNMRDNSRTAILNQGLNTPETGPRTKATADFFKEELGPKRGVTVENERIVRKPTGEEVKGAADIKQRVAKINPNKATLDTDAHELFHIFYPDLVASTNPKSKALAKRADRIVKESEEFRQWQTENPDGTPHEFMTSRVGVDSIRRLLNTDNTGNFRNWFRDFWSYQRMRTVDDVARVMSNKLVNDPSYAETTGIAAKVPVTPTGKEETPANVQYASGPAPAPVPAKTTTPLEKNRVSIPLLRSQIEKINRIESPKAGILARGLTKFYDDYNSFKGKLDGLFQESVRKLAGLKGIKNALLNPRGYLEQDNPILQSTLKKMYAAREGKNPTFTKEETLIRAEVQRVLKEVRDMQNARPALAKDDDAYDANYIPHITKASVIDIINANRESLKSIRLQNDFIKYQRDKLIAKGASPADAEAKAKENLETLLKGYMKRNVNTASQYGPIDKAEGLGLPESWRETNLLNAMHRYLDRVSKRFSYHDNIQTTPDVADALNVLGGDTTVRQVMDNVTGIKPPSERKRSAAFSVIRAANIGTLSGARDFIANFTLGMQHQQNPIQTIRTAAKAIANLKTFVRDGIASGRIRQNINELEWGDTVGWLRRTADVLSDVQGRNFLERITRGVSMGMGELTTMEFNQQVMRGKASDAAKKWFKDFGEGIDGSKPLTKDDIIRISGRFVDSVQGTYDPRGLPNFAMEGSWSPVFALARWNIEKANNYSKYVLSPLMEGNYKPFLMSTLGMVLGGTAVTELTELVTGRKDKTPKIGEIKASAEAGNNVTLPILYKAMGLATAAGYGGILSDIAKGAMDRMYGKTRPRWYNNMVFEVASNTAATVANLSEAIDEEGLKPGILIDAVGTILADNLQLARLVMNRIGEKKEDIEKSNKIRDLRTFNLMEGNKVSELYESDYSKKFKNKDIEKFKETTDVREAAGMVGGLISKALDNAEGNPEKLKQELSKIKRNSYQTMPNPETLPKSFVRYLSFLEKTQGKEARDARLLDYLKRNEINRAKSSMIP